MRKEADMGMCFSSSDPDEFKGWIPPGATEEFRKCLREREAQEARDREVAQKKWRRSIKN